MSLRTALRPLTAVVAIAAAAALAGCAGGSAPAPTGSDAPAETITLKVGAVTSPMTDIVEAAATEIEAPYKIEPVVVSDYVTINKMLGAGDLDATFSQHVPYMTEYNEKNGTDFVAVQPIYNFTIAFYSKTLKDIKDLPDGAKVAIPNDSSNAARALKMLDEAGIITLNPDVDPYKATLADITENPKNLQFMEVAIAQLNTAYEEADLVFQWPSHIAALGLTPEKDGLLTELDDHFTLQLDVRAEDEDKPSTAALKKAFTSDAVRKIIEANPSIQIAF